MLPGPFREALCHSEVVVGGKASCLLEIPAEVTVTATEEEVRHHISEVRILTSLCLQKVQIDLLPFSQYQNVHPIVKNLFSNVIPQVPQAGRIKYFLQNWKKLTTDVAILNIVQGLEIEFLRKPYQEKSPKAIPMSTLEKEVVNQEVGGHVKKGSNTESQIRERSVCQLNLPSGQERRGTSASGKLEGAEQIHSICSFQDGRASFSEGIITSTGFHGKTRLEGCILFSTLRSTFSKVHPI